MAALQRGLATSPFAREANEPARQTVQVPPFQEGRLDTLFVTWHYDPTTIMAVSLG